MSDHAVTGTDRTRPLAPHEQGVLDGLLAHGFPGVRELRVQATRVNASRGCDCGCGTIALHVPAGLPRSAADSPVPIEGTVVGDEGEPAGGVLLFVDEGFLSALEIYPLGDDPLPMPPPERVRWDAPEGVAGDGGPEEPG